jgi:hypothetical protein
MRVLIEDDDLKNTLELWQKPSTFRHQDRMLSSTSRDSPPARMRSYVSRVAASRPTINFRRPEAASSFIEQGHVAVEVDLCQIATRLAIVEILKNLWAVEERPLP